MRMEERKWRGYEDNVEAYEQALTSWTDDVPTCRESGLGSCTNELYRRDGSRLQLHPSEDRSFRFRVDEYDLCLYGIFDGFQGCQVADFAKKRLPAEILLGQLVPGMPDENVKEILKQAFICVDKEYFESIGDKLAARMVMRSDAQYAQSSRLAELDEKVCCGSSAILALTLGDRLYVASAGDCRAVLFRGGEVVPLWIEHTTTNEDELLRLSHLGLNTASDKDATDLGELRYTRCLGNYLVKGGYKESSFLAACKDEPVIPEPEVQGGIPINELEFLLLYTKSLWLAVAECSGSRDPDSVIVEMCREQFRAETSLSGVAQAVVDQVVRHHHASVELTGDRGATREDITLLIRLFGRAQQLRPEQRDDKTLTRSSIRPVRPTRSSTTTESSSLYQAGGKELPVDANGRIPPYVDFGPFYQLWNKQHQRRDSVSPEL